MATTRIVTVMIAEEDYKHSLWDTLTCEQLAEALHDSMSLVESFIWQEDWLVNDGVLTQDWEVHDILNRTTKVVRERPL